MHTMDIVEAIVQAQVTIKESASTIVQCAAACKWLQPGSALVFDGAGF